jgi:hypothetical protein
VVLVVELESFSTAAVEQGLQAKVLPVVPQAMLHTTAVAAAVLVPLARTPM